VLLDFAEEYLRQYERNAVLFERRMACLFEERRILIVPMLNPDGVSYSLHGAGIDNPLRERVLHMSADADLRLWRANARGVDLGLNYNADFTGCKQRERAAGITGGAPVGYSGEYPESEPETAALCRLVRMLREDIAGVLTLETGGEGIYCSCENKLSAKCKSAGRILQRVTGYRSEQREAAQGHNSLTDFCIAELSRPAYTLLCGRGAAPLPLSERPVLYERLRRALFTFPYML
jgi:g-D-glutamyl-meso-diaminopimelate peptidase